MKQLFITDLDHTFLNSNQTIAPFSKKVWKNITKHEYISIATARSFHKTEKFFKGLEFNAPLILLDGAMVITPDKQLLRIKTLNREIVDSIIEIGREMSIYPFIITLDNRQTLKESFFVPPILNNYQSTLIKKSYSKDPNMNYSKEIRGIDDTLKVVYMGHENKLRPLSINIKKLLGDKIEVKLAPEKYMGCYFLTILHPLGDKAHALKDVSDYLNIPLNRVTVFGDSINDIEMFKIAGTSIAVNNALDIVKKEADIILPHSNNEDGVAKYLFNKVKY